MIDRAMTTTRNSVPQRGWAVGYLRIASGVSGSPASEEDRDLDQPLDEVLNDLVLDVAGCGAGDEQGQQEEDPDARYQRDRQGQDDRALAELDAILFGLETGAPDQPAGPDDERLVEDDETADERQLGQAGSVDPGVELLGRPDDPTVGMAKGDRDRVPAAHEDALDQRLAAVGIARHAGSLPAGADQAGLGRLRRRSRP